MRSHGPMQASHPVSTMISEGISGITGSPFAGDDPDAHGTFLLRQEAVRFRSTRSPTLPPGAARIVFDTSETATCLTVQSPRHDLEKVAGGVRGTYVSEGSRPVFAAACDQLGKAAPFEGGPCSWRALRCVASPGRWALPSAREDRSRPSAAARGIAP